MTDEERRAIIKQRMLNLASGVKKMVERNKEMREQRKTEVDTARERTKVFHKSISNQYSSLSNGGGKSRKSHRLNGATYTPPKLWGR